MSAYQWSLSCSLVPSNAAPLAGQAGQEIEKNRCPLFDFPLRNQTPPRLCALERKRARDQKQQPPKSK
jgi:hypothetical protein